MSEVSTLVLSGAITREQLLSELRSHIPVTLAHEKDRPIGAPGRVTYTVTRGAMTARVENDGLSVTTLANAAIQVCKPLGPFCVTYGKCQPVLATTVHVPLLLDQDFGWRRPQSSVRAERGCAIAGFDVTGRLTSLAESNVQRINHQVSAALPEVKPWAQRIWQLSKNPVFLYVQHCLRLSPERFVQAPPRATEDGFEHRLGVELRLELTESCTREPEAPQEAPELAKLATLQQLPRTSQLSFTQVLSEQTLSAELGKSLKGSFGAGERVSNVSARSVRVNDENRLLLRVDLRGASCGTVWLTAQLTPAQDDKWSLAEIELLAPKQPAVKGLTQYLASHASVRPKLGFKDASQRLRDIVEATTALASEQAAAQAQGVTQQRLRITTDWGSPTLDSASVSDTGIRLSALVPLTAALSLVSSNAKVDAKQTTTRRDPAK